MIWFIEAWCPLDGYAFARGRGDTKAGRVSGQAAREELVGLAPPTFEPKPVDAAAAALPRSHGAFQRRFLRRDGSEVGFDRLEQIVELVRRAYVAAGIRGAPSVAQIGPAPELAMPAGDVDPSWRALCDDLLEGAGTEPGIAAAETLLGRVALAEVVRFASECLAAARREQSAGGATRADDLRNWALMVAETEALAEIDAGASPSGSLGHRGHGFLGRPLAPEGTLERAVLDGLLSRVPAPFRLPGYPSLRYLGDHLCAAMSDRGYWRRLPVADAALPVVTAALAVCGSWIRAPDAGPRAWCASAARWLSASLPDAALESIPEAAAAIRSVVDRTGLVDDD
jgi:hypothetical protein